MAVNLARASGYDTFMLTSAWGLDIPVFAAFSSDNEINTSAKEAAENSGSLLTPRRQSSMILDDIRTFKAKCRTFGPTFDKDFDDRRQ